MTLPLVKVKDKFQVTIPVELREALHLAVGDILEATAEHDTIVLKLKAVVDLQQAWNHVIASGLHLARGFAFSARVDIDENREDDPWPPA